MAHFSLTPPFGELKDQWGGWEVASSLLGCPLLVWKYFFSAGVKMIAYQYSQQHGAQRGASNPEVVTWWKRLLGPCWLGI